MRYTRTQHRPASRHVNDHGRVSGTHKRLDPCVMDSEQHKERVRSVVAAAPAEHRDWVRRTLGDRNRKGLKAQVREVVEASGEVYETIVRLWPSFVQDLVDYRNRSAHAQGGQIPEGQFAVRCQLAQIALQWVMRCLYLQEIGLSREDASKLVQETVRFERDVSIIEANL